MFLGRVSGEGTGTSWHPGPRLGPCRHPGGEEKTQFQEVEGLQGEGGIGKLKDSQDSDLEPSLETGAQYHTLMLHTVWASSSRINISASFMS